MSIKEKIIKKFLEKKCPDFLKIRNLIDKNIDLIENNFDEKEDNINKTFLLKGFMQSRKTWAIISIALEYYMRINTTVIIITENKLNALEQLTKRINEVISEFKFFLKEEKEEKLFKILSCQRGKKAKKKEINNAMNRIKPRIYFCMRNKKDIEPLNEIIEKTEKKFILIEDESDAIDTNTECNAQLSLNQLKEYSKINYFITATAITTLMKESIKKENLLILSKPENYKDLITFNFIKLENSKSITSNEDNLFEQDENIKTYISNFSEKKPYEIELWNNQKHPVITLIRIGIIIEPQIKLAKYIDKNYSEKIITITYNGTNITLRGKILPQKKISIENEESNFFKKVHHFSKIHIGSIISYLQNNIDCERIIIIAGKMADRGITFGNSNYNECLEEKKVPWHLTEMYYLASKTTEQPNLLQSAGRLCGCYPDNIPLTIYSNVCEDIIKAYHIQEELIIRAKEMETEIETTIDKIIPTLKIKSEKCSKRKITNRSVVCNLNQVKDDSKEGGWNWLKTLNKIRNEEIKNLEDLKNERKNWAKIIKLNLTKNDREIYEKIKEKLKKGKNKSFKKTELIKKLFPENYQKIINHTWHWTDNEKYFIMVDSKTKGLILQQREDKLWYIKYN